MKSPSGIVYPYLPEGRVIKHAPADHLFMVLAKEFARKYSVDKSMPVGCVIAKDGHVLGMGANGSDYHEHHGCERVKLQIPSGQQYELCEGCSTKNHGEARAIANARELGYDIRGAQIYTYGHWFFCSSCWDKMIEAELGDAFMMEGSERLFNREHPDNIVGRQFA